MQPTFISINERMGQSEELVELKHDPVTGCHCCNKAVCEVSSLVNIQQSAGIL